MGKQLRKYYLNTLRNIAYYISKLNQKNMNLKKHIWEGWTVQDFINDLKPTLAMIMAGRSHNEPIKTKDELKKWCMDNQPYYKKYIPEVVSYFAKEYSII